MPEKKQLNEEQLEKVNGGGWAEDMSEHLPSTHGVHISQYEAENHKNEKVYAVMDAQPYNWLAGTLKDSYEGTHHRYHVIEIDELHGGLMEYGFNVGQTATFEGGCVTIFLYN